MIITTACMYACIFILDTNCGSQDRPRPCRRGSCIMRAFPCMRALLLWCSSRARSVVGVNLYLPIHSFLRP